MAALEDDYLELMLVFDDKRDARLSATLIEVLLVNWQ